jgi:uncharacterized protein (DUF1697 family)
MSVEIGLLRGINVGGTHVLPMAELRAILAGLGARDVRTYIQSGNAAWAGHVDEAALSDAILAAKGFRPAAMILPFDSFAAVVANNPFPEVEDPKALHAYFLAAPSLADEAMLEVEKGPEERFVLTERAFYLHTPLYLTGSLLAPRLERLLGVPATGRNWRTVDRLLAMAAEIAAG